MELSLPSRFRIQNTWSIGSSGGRDSGFIDIQNGMPWRSTGSQDPNFTPYSGYATSIELNPHFNYWAVVETKNGGYSGKDATATVVLFPSKRWFDEWYSAIPQELEPKILLQCAEGKTGVE